MPPGPHPHLAIPRVTWQPSWHPPHHPLPAVLGVPGAPCPPGRPGTTWRGRSTLCWLTCHPPGGGHRGNPDPRVAEGAVPQVRVVQRWSGCSGRREGEAPKLGGQGSGWVGGGQGGGPVQGEGLTGKTNKTKRQTGWICLPLTVPYILSLSPTSSEMGPKRGEREVQVSRSGL